MVNFTNETKELADDVSNMFKELGFLPTISTAADKNRPKYTVRLARNAEKFIEMMGFSKT